MRLAAWGYPHREFPPGHDGVDEMQSRLETLRDAGIGLYFSYIADADEHYFSSETLGPPARDLLGPLREAGDRADVAIHPVLDLTTLAAEDAGHYRPSLESTDAPEWTLSWPCASWGENHERAILIAGDLIEAYDPPGIHLDHSRFPDADVLADNPCVCERCVAARLEWLGKPRPEPQDLRKRGVAFKELQMRVEFVRSYVESMRGLTDHYGVGLSAAVRARYYEDALAEGQDWAEWCADGLVDLVCPKTWPFSFGQFARLISQHRRLTGATPATWLGGIAVQAEDEKLPLDEVERRTRFMLRADADGICIANSDELGDNELAMLSRLVQD